jgi:hypothetical protein
MARTKEEKGERLMFRTYGIGPRRKTKHCLQCKCLLNSHNTYDRCAPCRERIMREQSVMKNSGRPFQR